MVNDHPFTPASATALSGRWSGKAHRAADGEAAEGSMARGGRQFRSHAVDYARGEDEVEAWASISVRPRRFTDGRDASAAGMARRGEGEAANERSMDESDVEVARIESFFSVKTGYEQMETRGGLRVAKSVVPEEQSQDGDAEEVTQAGEAGRLVLQFRPSGRFSCCGNPPGLSAFHAVRPARGAVPVLGDAVRVERRSEGVL